MSEATNVKKNALSVGAANFLSRITGLLREIAFAAAFGAGVAADAYNAAFRIGSLFRELFAEGSLANAFVPLYADVEEKEGPSGAFALANAFLGVLLVAVGAVTLLTFVMAEPFVYVIAAGYAETPGKVELTAQLTRILAPFIATISVASVFSGMLNVRGRFFLPAAASILFNVLTIGACVGADAFEAATGLHPIFGMAIAALLGGASQALVQIPTLRKTGFRFEITLGKHPELKRLLAFVGPAVIAIAVVQVNLLIETQLASNEGDGPVSWLLYAFRIVHLPLSIFSVAVGVASLAGLSVLAAQHRHDEFRDTVGRALNINSFLLAPAGVGLFLLAEPVVRLMFERGAFTSTDTQQTALMLQMYCVALLGIGAHRVLLPIFYALMDPWTPMWAGLAVVLLKLPVAWALMYPAGFGVQGLPLSHAALVTSEVVFLLVVLNKRVRGVAWVLLREHLRIFVAAGLMGAAVWAGLTHGPPVGDTLTILVSGAAGAALYFILGTALGLREGRELLKRVLKRRPPGLPPTVDPTTAEILGGLSSESLGPVVVEDGVARIPASGGTVLLRAVDGQLTAVREGPPIEEDGESVPVTAVMKVGGGPPRLCGLLVGDTELSADGDRVVSGVPAGPRIPL